MEEAQAHLKTAQVLLKYAEENYGAQSGEYMTALRNVHTCSKELEDVLDRFLDIDQIHQILGTLPKSSNIVLARDALFKNNTTNPFRDK